MKSEVKITSDFSPTQVKVHMREHLELEASIALALLERWAMICATVDGEDSAGRSKVRELTPIETVDRAFETGIAFANRARRDGHVTVLPSLAEIEAAEVERKKLKERT